MRDWLFGCDICQDVCPWNSKSSLTDEPAFFPTNSNNPVDLLPLFSLTEQQFRERFRRTPFSRARRRGVLRNAAIVLGNNPTKDALAALSRGLHDEEAVVRSASAWALGRIGTKGARVALENRLGMEEDEQVIDEIRAAIESG
jgi:epoxyqueuosine reductase